MRNRDQPLAYTRGAAIVTMALYSAGHATIGFVFLFLGALWRLLNRRPPLWQPTVLDRPFLALAAVLAISAAFSPYRLMAVEVSLMLIAAGVVYFGSFAWVLHRDPGARTALLKAWALGAAPAAVVGFTIGAMTHSRAIFPRGVDPNALGMTLLLGSVLALGLASAARGRDRGLWLACAAVSFVGLLATASRASLAGWAAGTAYLVWSQLRAQPRRMAAALAAAFVLLVLGGALTPQLTARVRYTVSDVSGNRFRIWQTSLRMIGARPLLGTGFGTFGQAYERWKDPGMSPEPFAFNLWMNVAVEIGLLGLLGALWVALTAVREWQARGRRGPPGVDPMRPAITAVWVGLLVEQSADNALFAIGTSAVLWLMLALLVVPAPESEQGTPDAQLRHGEPGWYDGSASAGEAPRG